jgi:hypothetical protein
VAVPSCGGIDPPDAVLDVARSWLAANGLSPRLLKDRECKPAAVWVEIAGADPGPLLCLDACIDTAPAGDPGQWMVWTDGSDVTLTRKGPATKPLSRKWLDKYREPTKPGWFMPDCTGEGPTYSVNGRRLHEEVAKGKRWGAAAPLPLFCHWPSISSPAPAQVLSVARCEAITTAAAVQSAFAVASVRERGVIRSSSPDTVKR